MLRQKDRPQIYKVAVNAALGSILFGYQLVDISMLQGRYMNVNAITKQQTRLQISIITASMPLMAILGSALMKNLMRKFKGRYLMIYMDLLGIIGMSIQCISLSLWALLIGRMILGFVVGVNSGLIAQYTFSVTPTSLSGTVGALRQVFLNVGVAAGYIIGFIINSEDVHDQLNWRILIAFPILTCTIRAILLLTVLPYEIPLNRMRSKKIEMMQKHYFKIYQNYAQQSSQNPSSNPQKLDDSVLYPSQEPEKSMESISQEQKRNVRICVILAFSNQFCGINAIIFYAKQLFMRITNDNNNVSQSLIILFGLVQIVATFIGGKLMDKHSKKKFLIYGEISMAVILLCIFVLEQYTSFVVILIFLHSIAYSFSIGQLLLFYAAKMLDNTGYIVGVNWFATFLVALSAQFMMKILGIGNMCLFFCLLLTICLAFMGTKLPSDQELLQRQMALLEKVPQQKAKRQSVELKSEIIKEDLSTQAQKSEKKTPKKSPSKSPSKSSSKQPKKQALISNQKQYQLSNIHSFQSQGTSKSTNKSQEF